MFSCHVIDFRGWWPRLYGIDIAPVTFDVAEDALHMVALPHQYATGTSEWPCRVATRGILQSSDRDEFPQSGRRHGPLCNTLIIRYHLF